MRLALGGAVGKIVSILAEGQVVMGTIVAGRRDEMLDPKGVSQRWAMTSR